MFCHICGTKLDDDVVFCYKCGTRVTGEETKPQEPIHRKAEQETAVPQEMPIASEPVPKTPQDTPAASKEMPNVPIEKVVAKQEPLEFSQAEPKESSHPVEFTDEASRDIDRFRAFVDERVRETTKFQSANDLLAKSKYWPITLSCFVIPMVLWLFIDIPVSLFRVLIGLGVPSACIIGWIIGAIYSKKYSGVSDGPIVIEELTPFLDKYLKYISPDFHEWDYYQSRALRHSVTELLSIYSYKEVRLGCEFGAHKNRLVRLNIRPNKANPNSGPVWYFVGAATNGWHIDTGTSDFLSQATLIKTAPIMHAVMEYYLKYYKGSETARKQIEYSLSTAVGEGAQQTSSPNYSSAEKKKHSKRNIVLGIIAALVVILVIIVAFWDGEIDYKATVENQQPFTTQGLNCTYGEVFEKYILSPKWEVREFDGGAYVDLTGDGKGTDRKLAVTIKVTLDPDNKDHVTISPEVVAIDGVESPTKDDAVETLLTMFAMYDQGYEDLSEFINDSDELCFNGVAISTLFTTPVEDLIASGTLGPAHYDEKCYCEGGECYVNDDGVITSGEVTPSYLKINGVSLDKNRDELVELLGEPSYEGYSQGYLMEFDLEDCSLSIELGEPTDDAWRIRIISAKQPKSEGNISNTEDEIGDVYTLTNDVHLYSEMNDGVEIEMTTYGVFSMDVNLYEGGGRITGRYVGTKKGFRFYVADRNFSGFLGDDVDEFELLVVNNGLQYKGDAIGTLYEGVMFY